MMNVLIKKVSIWATALLMLAGFVGVAMPAMNAYAQDASKKAMCESTGGTWSAKNGTCASPGGVTAESSLSKIVKTIVNIFSWVVGVVAVIMVIVGGLKFITSSGDSNNVKSARNTITYAIIGLVVVALAQVIVAFVLNTATS